MFIQALDYAPAGQRIHFVTGVTEKRCEHLVRVLSELRRGVIGIEGCFTQVNGIFDSLHVPALACDISAIMSRARSTSLSQTSATVRMAPQGTPPVIEHF